MPQFSEEQLQIQSHVRRVARATAARASESDRSVGYPQDMFELPRAPCLFALPLPAEYGGTGWSLSACLTVQWITFGAILAGGTELAPRAATAQAFAPDPVMKVSIDAVPLCGADGVSADYPFGRYMRDAKALRITEGVTHIRRHNIANPLLGRVRQRPTGHGPRYSFISAT